jgi:hypothetical protein
MKIVSKSKIGKQGFNKLFYHGSEVVLIDWMPTGEIWWTNQDGKIIKKIKMTEEESKENADITPWVNRVKKMGKEIDKRRIGKLTTPNLSFEEGIKKRILQGLAEGVQGKEWVISVYGGKDFHFDKLEMVNAIYKIGKRK